MVLDLGDPKSRSMQSLRNRIHFGNTINMSDLYRMCCIWVHVNKYKEHRLWSLGETIESMVETGRNKHEIGALGIEATEL